MKTRAKIGIFIISIMLQSSSALSLAISGISQSFPNVPVESIQLVFTLTSLMALLGTLVAGKLAGVTTKKILIIFFSLLSFAGAMVGFFFPDSLEMLYASSVVIGLSVGILAPIATALIAELFQGGERASVNGLQSLFINGGAMMLNMLGGVLVSIAWHDVYLIYGLMVIVAIASVVLLPKGVVEKSPEGEKAKVLTPFFASMLLQSLLLGIAWMTLMANASYSVMQLGLDPGSAGILTAAQFAGGIVVGLLLRPIMQMTRKWCFVVANAVAAIALWILFFASNLPMLILGSLILGAGFGFFMPAGYTIIPSKAHPATITTSLSLFLGLFTVGGFINPYIITAGAQLLGSDLSFRFMLAAIVQTANIAVSLVAMKKYMGDMPEL